MHHSGPLPLTFEGPEQGFGGKNCQNGSGGGGGNLASTVKPAQEVTSVKWSLFVAAIAA